MMPVKQINDGRQYFIAVLAMLIIPISGLSTDIYVPSLPAVSLYFNVDKSLVQLTITAYMLGMGIMQLFAGPISDTFGRKSPFLIAMAIFISVTLCIPWSSSIYELLLFRLLQGLAMATVMVSMRSVVPDLFKDQEVYKMMNYMTVAWSIGPIIAPAIGGYLQAYFGWKANFHFLASYSILAFSLAWFYLPETSQHFYSFRVTNILQRYKAILLNFQFMQGLIINGLLYSIMLLFAVVGPFLIQKEMHYSAIQNGQFSLLIGLSWFLGALTNRFMLTIKLAIKTMVCLWTMLLIGGMMLLAALVLPMNIYIIVPPLFLMSWLGGIIFPNNFARAITLFPTMTGSANALFGGVLFIISSISSGLAALLKSSTQLPLTMAYIGLISTCLIIFYVGQFKIKPN
jgi:Bcr/CflA subfamily drug resistance transporter